MSTEYQIGDYTKDEWLRLFGLVGVDDPKIAALASLSWGGNALKVLRVNATENGWELAAVTTYTDEMARDAIGAALVAGSGITVTVNDGADTITIASSITQYTDENARDAIGTALQGTANQITVTPNDGADTITLSLPSAITAPGSVNATTEFQIQGARFARKLGSEYHEISSPSHVGIYVGGAGDQTIYLDDNTIRLRKADHSTGLGTINDAAWTPGVDNVQNLGSGSLRFGTVYAGTGTINTSDQREKREIGTIPDEWLDAWGDVEWVRFRYKTGDRWHVGLVAQRVHKAFARHGIDAFEIGLCCYDEWEAEKAVPAEYDREGNLIRFAQPGRKAGNRWSLRYEECQAMEAAWLRREVRRLSEARAK